VLGWLWLFLIFSFNIFVLTFVVYWSAANTDALTLLGMKFKNIWTFWLGYVLVCAPIYIFVNYLFSGAYWYGYKKVFPSEMWKVVETQWLASLVVTFFVTWLYLGELPTKNAIAASIFLAGALIAILWK
jgi:hypothetical protein